MLPSGITSLHHIARTVSAIRGWQDWAREGTLPVRVGVLVRAFNGETQLPSNLNTGLRHGFGNSWLTFQGEDQH